MSIIHRHATRLMASLIIAIISVAAAHADGVLIITSYNPDTPSTAETISSFLNEVQRRGYKGNISVETLNVLSFNELTKWSKQMSEILNHHSGANRPQLVVVLGQEAWSAFLSQTDADHKSLPVMCGMVSRNTVLAPSDTTQLQLWMPESKDLLHDFDDFNIVGGEVYQYRLTENIGLIKQFYPATRRIALLTDNTFGGVCMQALVREEMTRYPEYEFTFLDGRRQSPGEVSDSLMAMTDGTALLLGTWRVGPTDDFALKNTTIVLRNANPKLPVFTLSSTGLGHWAIGGYIPDYCDMGPHLATQAIDYLQSDGVATPGPTLLNGHFVADERQLQERKLDSDLLPANHETINHSGSFLANYQTESMFVALLMGLLGCILFAIWFHVRKMHRYRNSLARQNVELAKARQTVQWDCEMKDRFIECINNEMRNSLTSIIDLANAIEHDTASSTQGYAHAIDTHAKRLAKLLIDVGDLSRLDSGIKDIKPVDASIAEINDYALSLVSTPIAPGVTLTIVPPQGSQAQYPVYIGYVSKVVANLIDNAFKFTTEGSITLASEVSPDESVMTFTVSDTGIGVPPSMREAIFERFIKIDDYTPGAGLGLPLCRKIASILGGTVMLLPHAPSSSTGCSFRFIVPINQGHSEEQP